MYGIAIVRGFVPAVAAIGASSVASTAISQLLTPTNKIHAVKLFVGSAVISTMVGAAASAYTSAEVDKLIGTYLIMTGKVKDEPVVTTPPPRPDAKI